MKEKIQFSFFKFFERIAFRINLCGLQYVTLHFNAFPPPDGLDKNLLVSFVQIVLYKKCLFLTFLPQGLDTTFFLEVETFSPVSNILIIIILTIT